jgi:hypothetical protein
MSLQRTVKKKDLRDLYEEINELKKGYQPRNNLVMDENSNLLADSQNKSKEVEELIFCY